MPGGSGGYNFHFGFNLMDSGHDYITLEDYAGSGLKYYLDMYGPTSKGQSWAEDPSNASALGNKTTTMVAQHPESIKGETNYSGVHFVDDPGKPTSKLLLAKGTKVEIIRKGQSWMKVRITAGTHAGKSGWIMNKYYTDS